MGVLGAALGGSRVIHRVARLVVGGVTAAGLIWWPVRSLVVLEFIADRRALFFVSPFICAGCVLFVSVCVCVCVRTKENQCRRWDACIKRSRVAWPAVSGDPLAAGSPAPISSARAPCPKRRMSKAQRGWRWWNRRTRGGTRRTERNCRDKPENKMDNKLTALCWLHPVSGICQ